MKVCAILHDINTTIWYSVEILHLVTFVSSRIVLYKINGELWTFGFRKFNCSPLRRVNVNRFSLRSAVRLSKSAIQCLSGKVPCVGHVWATRFAETPRYIALHRWKERSIDRFAVICSIGVEWNSRTILTTYNRLRGTISSNHLSFLWGTNIFLVFKYYISQLWLIIKEIIFREREREKGLS